jgi:hypothetical protein
LGHLWPLGSGAAAGYGSTPRHLRYAFF